MLLVWLPKYLLFCALLFMVVLLLVVVVILVLVEYLMLLFMWCDVSYDVGVASIVFVVVAIAVDLYDHQNVHIQHQRH